MANLAEFSISFEYGSPWLIIICLLVGLLYAAFLYRKESRLKDSPRWVVKGLSIFRFVTVSLLAFLLLNPLIKRVIYESEKPIIVFAQDASESILITKPPSFSDQDSLTFVTDYKDKVSNLLQQLEQDYDVTRLSIGNNITDGVDYRFNRKQTNLSLLFTEIQKRIDERNLGALILATDGIYNLGANPIYASATIKAPIYTIALGDTRPKKDLILSKVLHNKLAFLGNEFPLEIDINSRQCNGEKSQLIIVHNGKTVFKETIEITNDQFNTNIPVQLEANNQGIQRYSIALTKVNDEVSTKNNYKDIFIDVLDSRQKILILANSPHPDLTTLKSAIESNQNYEVNISIISDFKKGLAKKQTSLNNYNLVILHQLPSKGDHIKGILGEISANQIPVLYIIGTQSSIAGINNLKSGIQIQNNKNNYNNVQTYPEKEFALFNISSDLINRIEDFPPLLAPFGTYKVSEQFMNLLYQKIGVVNTAYPLLSFQNKLEVKSGFFFGEGIWKWYLYEFATHDDHLVVNELITKTIQFLALKADKRKFRIYIEKNIFLENEPIRFDAEVYNQSYELINEPEIKIDIINSEGKSFPFTFSKSSNAYTLEAGLFEVGNYTYSAKVQTADGVFTLSGQFSVSPIQEEALQTVADHQMLYMLASKKDGEMIYPEQIPGLYEKLKNRKELKSIIYTRKKMEEIINLPWVMGLIILLLAVEWFVRKREGAV